MMGTVVQVARPRLVVVGGSAGGVEALLQFVGQLSPRFPLPIAVVIHSSSAGLRSLPNILSRSSELRSVAATDGETLRPGTIYVAASDHHLLIRGHHVHVIRGPKENGHRPAVDPLFRSAATSYGGGAVGVILSGALDDGTAGLAAIVSRGGTAVVQDPDDALFASMPRSAITHVDVHHVVPAVKVALILETLVNDEENGEGKPAPEASSMEYEMEVVEPADELPGEPERPPSALTCPECQGSLWEFREGSAVHFRCRVGHAFSPATLMLEQSVALEAALWAAVRSLQERATLSEHLAGQARARGGHHTASRFDTKAAEARERSEIIREALLSATESPDDGSAGEADGDERTGDIEEAG